MAFFSNMVFEGTVILYFLQHLLIISATGLSVHQHHFPFRHSLETDKAALLAFKGSISFDPYSRLANWNETTHVCRFTGIACDGRHHHRVVRLNLNDSGLVGRLSPFISNLTQLRVIELVNNQFSGFIPSEFGFLRNLHHIKLDGNNLCGPIPETFSFLANLTLVALSGNNLSGTIPPSFFSNCTSLHNVDLSENFLSGKIPPEIGSCPKLWTLNIYSNQLEGEIPSSITNASELFNFDAENNQLSGELPVDVVSKLYSINYLHLSYNNMISQDANTNLEPFFTALSNCSELEELELAGMRLGGSLPYSIGGVTKTLAILLLQENHIHGSIPPQIAHLSNLKLMNLTLNQFNGTIPDEIGQFSYLEQLSLSFNSFSGEIPAALGQLSRLGLLDLSNNQLSGKIPESFGDLVNIYYLFLNNNLLSGKIPRSLGKCRDLNKLDLSYNKLTGSIPPEMGIRGIGIFLNLSHNQLEGHIPIELSKLENVQEIDLSSNQLGGIIFVQISSCIALQTINLSNNFLEGQLPESLGELWSLKVLDVAWNKLSGRIPSSLNKTSTLTFLNLSFNNFDGRIPTGGIFDFATNLSFVGNQHLCGIIPGFPTCHQKLKIFHSHLFLIILCSVVSVSMFSSTICCVIGCQRLKVVIGSTSQPERENQMPPEVMHNFPRITYKELAEATGGFEDQRLIGSGSYGRVYKGVLPDGTSIAVKVLHLQTGNSTKSFNRECQVLKRIRHRNLMRIITACSLPDFKALVLPYMANGSLDSRLYPHPRTGLSSGSSDLSLPQRINICSDIAEGMAYLHHHSPVKVIHCDLKPSNVLLNDDMTALVSDFGIARLVMTIGAGNAGVMENMGNSTANLLRGSVGYIAPEYGLGASASTKGDVYSFGVMVLEMVTRKRPTDDMFVGGLSLHRYVKRYYHREVEKIVDSSLIRAVKDETPEVKKMSEVAIGELIELGILCTQDSPSARPTMLDAADDLNRLKKYLGGDTTATFASSLGISSSTFSSDW
ncbi:uncharacterized protein [Coffea arabica]|uniref:non-specific serine/threonine protein kinase n=1 Tax=Coffea arabica TaxID=13443 RepID=A0A6P6X5M3_COFAR|nr:putative leucine-rich repeat receptor-like serine/threonine-protein kinase At2g24130 [Coffea arabica]